MFTLLIGGTELSFRNDLGVTRDIKKAFRKDYMDVVRGFDKMSIEDLLKFVYTTMTDESKDGQTLHDFTEWAMSGESNIGLLDLMDAVTEINMEIQMPGLSPDERKKRIMDAQREAKEYYGS